MTVIKLEIENKAKGAKCLYDGFNGIDRWGDEKNFIEVDYNNKKYKISLKDDLSKIIIYDTKSKKKNEIALLDKKSSLNVTKVLKCI